MEKLVTIVSVDIVKGFWKHRTWGENNDRHENIFIITDIQNL